MVSRTQWRLIADTGYNGVPERKSGGFVLKGMNMNPLFPIEFLGEGALCAE